MVSKNTLLKMVESLEQEYDDKISQLGRDIAQLKRELYQINKANERLLDQIPRYRIMKRNPNGSDNRTLFKRMYKDEAIEKALELTRRKTPDSIYVERISTQNVWVPIAKFTHTDCREKTVLFND